MAEKSLKRMQEEAEDGLRAAPRDEGAEQEAGPPTTRQQKGKHQQGRE